MKNFNVLIYVNKDKDPSLEYCKNLKNSLSMHNIKFEVIDEFSKVDGSKFDAIFVIGGDGTILRRTEFANRYSLPIIGINAGKLGFLSEFEPDEIDEAVSEFINGEMEEDPRSTLEITYNGKVYLGLNDIVIQRIYTESHSMIITNTVLIDGSSIGPITGDGVIVCTPTGSTAYSLSVGGAILAPGINAFLVTPIAAHSFSQRPVVFSAESTCEIVYESGVSAGVFIDGNMVSTLKKGDRLIIKKSKKPTMFLRKKDYAFYEKLLNKLKDRVGF